MAEPHDVGAALSQAALEGEPTLVDEALDALTRELVAQHRPDVVGMSVPFPGNVYGAFRMARVVRAMAPHAKLVLGGGWVNTELRALREPRVFDYFDYVTLDDGERPMLNLLARLAGRLRAAGETVPGCLWLVSPWTDLTMSGATLATKDAIDPIIHHGYLEELAEAYVPASMDRRDPLVSPLFANLRNFPPMLIQVGSAETLLSDATRLAEAAGGADVDVRLEIWPHMIHAWPVWNAALEDGRRALAAAGAFIRAWIA